MKLLINDANILIDIVKLELVEAFLSLDFDLHTTDFVFAELEDYQQESLKSEHLGIIKTENQEDFEEIIGLLNNNKGLSFEDCSVWHYAKKLNGTLVTGDGILRKKVTHAGIVVKGIIYILEEIKNQNKLSIDVCILKLNELKNINNRLPKHEIDIRIIDWTNER